MQQEENYKENIASTRVGCLGGSDGRMLAQIASLGTVPNSALKRLAVCKGLIPQTDIPKTAAIKAGDELEMLVYEHLSAKDPRYESNPLWVSERYSHENVKLIAHPDLVLKDDGRKTIFIYECKCTKFSVEETKQTYKAQMFIEYLLGKELAKKLGDDWKVKISLVHYNTDGLNLEEGIDFDPSRLSVNEVKFINQFFDINLSMNIVSAFLEDFNEYYEGDEVDADLLPQKIKDEFDMVAATLVEIKERETLVENFKQRLYTFMTEKNIKSVKNDAFSIVRVDPTESKSFDAKKYVDDLKKEHPRKAKKLVAKYTKVVKRKGYAQIKVKTEK